ncbi:MAG TPA: DJ-1/PfpI family protein [Methanothrix sp.]|nr:DJ-1/PfpI family protein [Methanothrix sp.]
MKNIFSVLAALILLSLGACPSLAQYYDGYGDGYYDGYEEGYTCWMCPYCGFVILLDVQVYESATEYQTTLGEVTYLNPSDPEYYCPYCGTYGAYFVLVPCSEYYEDEEEYGDYEEYDNVEYCEENGNGENYEEECEEVYIDDGEECADGGEYSECDEGYEESEHVETGDECEKEADEIGDNETEAADEPLTGGEETVNVAAPASIETPLEEAAKILIVIPSKEFNDVEFNTTEAIFLDEGFKADVASKGTKEAVGMDGTVVAVDLEVADAADLSDYEAVVFIGGPGVEELLLYKDLDHLSLASSTRDQDIIVGGICVAPKILANAWLLDGKSATVFPDSESIAYIKSRGAIYSDEQVVRDGNIITASGPEASVPFAEAVVAAVKEGQV